MPESKKQDFTLTLQWFQLAILAVGVGGFFVDIGKRSQLIDKTDKDLAELKVIVQDLVKAQIQSYANDSNHKLLLEDLKARVVELERKQ